MHPSARKEWTVSPPLPCDSHFPLPWYVIRTAPFREAKVRDRLDDRGFGTFLPEVVVERIKRRFRWGRFYEERRRKVVVAFPTYVFACFDVQRPAWRAIYGVKDVAGILRPPGAPERPVPVSPDAIQALIALGYDRPIVKDAVQDLIQAGASVTVTDGPFAAFTGICAESKKDRIKVLVSLFGRDTLVMLKPSQVTVSR